MAPRRKTAEGSERDSVTLSKPKKLLEKIQRGIGEVILGKDRIPYPGIATETRTERNGYPPELRWTFDRAGGRDVDYGGEVGIASAERQGKIMIRGETDKVMSFMPGWRLTIRRGGIMLGYCGVCGILGCYIGIKIGDLQRKYHQAIIETEDETELMLS
ncbi:unnamed protein product [Cyprideis torosa]|uniref:Uncharacterized protein n=1 Tax=Cyprideis torosa TaxID=163714 RepID=A0A7R8WP70_9CRUS|nr:unnamed protein product [Cyprideis torosa]CAG0906673.1 unnamed protein product [Cyprideis torosa]